MYAFKNQVTVVIMRKNEATYKSSSPSLSSSSLFRLLLLCVIKAQREMQLNATRQGGFWWMMEGESQ